MSSFQDLQSSLVETRSALLNHSLYARLDSLSALHVLMENHVFAVWDFMSLLKSLQNELTCVSVPWNPCRNASACRLINQIVLAEESDTDPVGQPASHFELYLTAMEKAGADSTEIQSLISLLQAGHSVRHALQQVSILPATRAFVETTFDIIGTGDLCQIAAAFTFGREDLLPDVFQRIVDEIDQTSPEDLSGFQYYLERHIELDGDEHGLMAKQLMEELCGDDAERWQAAKQAAVLSLGARLRMWDEISIALDVEAARQVASECR